MRVMVTASNSTLGSVMPVTIPVTINIILMLHYFISQEKADLTTRHEKLREFVTNQLKPKLKEKSTEIETKNSEIESLKAENESLKTKISDLGKSLHVYV